MKPTRADFPRCCRLINKKAFERVLRNRTQVIRQGCIRAYVLGNTTTTAKLGIIVGKKQFPTAIARNRIKRLIRNSFRLSRAKLLKVDVVVQVFSGENEKQFKMDLENLWFKLEDPTSRCRVMEEQN